MLVGSFPFGRSPLQRLPSCERSLILQADLADPGSRFVSLFGFAASRSVRILLNSVTNNATPCQLARKRAVRAQTS